MIGATMSFNALIEIQLIVAHEQIGLTGFILTPKRNLTVAATQPHQRQCVRRNFRSRVPVEIVVVDNRRVTAFKQFQVFPFASDNLKGIYEHAFQVTLLPLHFRQTLQDFRISVRCQSERSNNVFRSSMGCGFQ